jgi:hypothetical protein
VLYIVGVESMAWVVPRTGACGACGHKTLLPGSDGSYARVHANVLKLSDNTNYYDFIIKK